MCVEFVSQDPDSLTDWLCTPLVCPLLSPATCLFSAIVLDCWSFWREFKNSISYYSSNTTIFHISLMAVCQIMVEFQHQPPASYLNIMKSYIENIGKTTPGLNLSSIALAELHCVQSLFCLDSSQNVFSDHLQLCSVMIWFQHVRQACAEYTHWLVSEWPDLHVHLLISGVSWFENV